ncbi:MAG: AAA family ATPase [Planctomycetia bacterium]|nr:AAA family ATPase [Planctomycetia bacterium]
MIIKDLRIEGFGVWSDLELNDLDGGLTLLYGENETGKTTLLEFMRSVLYGYNDERRAKYLPPVHGGIGGGMLSLEAHAGKFKVRRRAEGDPHVGRLDLTNLQGTAQDSRLLKKILADLDEPTFKNVFALGLGEIQELSSLSGSGAAEYLYDLAVGSGGVSLTEVHKELENSRNRLFSSERNSMVGQLLDRRSGLKSDIEQLRQHGRGYALLADERERLAGDVERCEVEADELRRNAGLLEAAIAVYDRWHRRNKVEAELTKIGELKPIAAETWTKLAQLKDRYREQLPLIAKLKKERADVKKQALTIRVNKTIWQQGPRIEVLAAQEGWIETLETEIKKLESEATAAKPIVATSLHDSGRHGASHHSSSHASVPMGASVRRESLSAEWVKLGLTPSTAEKLGDRKVLRTLHRAFRDVQASDKRVAAAAEAEARRREVIAATAEEAKPASQRRESGATLEDKSQLVGNLRKRVQLDQKIDQLTGHREEAQRQLREKLAMNTVPADAIFNPGLFFIVGVCAFLSGVLLPNAVVGDGLLHYFLVFAGGLTALFAGAFKIMRDTTNNEELDTLRRQSRSIETQLHDLTSERDQIDPLLPPGGGPMLARLQAAEKDLSTHEEAAAGETRRTAGRTAGREELETTRVELRVAEEEGAKAHKRLRQEFDRIGLPERMTWEQIRGVARGRTKHEAHRRREERRLKYLNQRRSELALIADRISQLFTEAQLEPKGDRLVDHLRQLNGEWKRNEDLLERRKGSRAQYRSLDRRLKTARQETATLRRRRKAFFRSLGVSNEKQLQRRREHLKRRDELLAERDGISREIVAALGQRGSEDDLHGRLEQYQLPQLEQRWTELCDRLAAIDKRLRELYEEQGRLRLKLEQIAADKSLPRKIYELNNVERQIGQTLEEWQELTVAQRLLEAVRKKYEAERQPETLREASRYFERLTEGKYKRVWTPLEAGVLFVDTAGGEKLSVEVLSRGTREQLFLALRLALVDLYARRGKVMPLVLDDVLVNFDTRRTRIAAELLRDFAGDRRQVLLFTCHEHIYRMFKTLRTEVRLLPGQSIMEEDEGPVRYVDRVVEKVVEKVVKVKEPVYLQSPAPEPPPSLPLPRFDGTGVFHLAPRPAPIVVREAPKPAPVKPVVVETPPPKEPEYEDIVEETLVEAPARTILHTKRVGYPIVPMWSPTTPFAEATWQDSIEDDETEHAATNGKRK